MQNKIKKILTALTVNCPLSILKKKKILHHFHFEDVGAAIKTWANTIQFSNQKPYTAI